MWFAQLAGRVPRSPQLLSQICMSLGKPNTSADCGSCSLALPVLLLPLLLPPLRLLLDPHLDALGRGGIECASAGANDGKVPPKGLRCTSSWRNLRSE